MAEIQRLRCRVAFHALQFRPEIQTLGRRMVHKLRALGQPFLAFHPGLLRETLAYNGCAELFQKGKLISREEFDKIMAKEKTEQIESTEMDEAMAKAVDIGENDDEEDSDVDGEEEGEEEKLSDYWSVLKSTPELRQSKPKPKKEGPLSLDEAIEESENLTDFLMDFEEEE